MIQRMLAIWSLVPQSFLKPTWTSGSSWFTYYWSLAWRNLSITLLACELTQLCGSLSILWHCLSLELEWKLTFSSPVATAEGLPAGILSVPLFTASSFRIWNSSTRIPSSSLALFMGCFLRPTWLHIPGCLALGEWSYHHDYLGLEDLFCTVLLCTLATSSQNLLLLLGPYHFCPLSSLSLHEIFPWYL